MRCRSRSNEQKGIRGESFSYFQTSLIRVIIRITFTFINVILHRLFQLRTVSKLNLIHAPN